MAYRSELARGDMGSWQEVQLVSSDTFWSTEEGRRCTLEIFWSQSAGNVARVTQFAEALQADGSIVTSEIQSPVTCRLPDDSRDYMLEFIQNFTENKMTNGYAHVATTTDPRLPVPEMRQQSFARPSHDGHVAGSARYEYSEGNMNQAANGDTAEDFKDQSSQKKGAVSGFDLGEVSKYFHLPIHEAAAKLGVGETWLKQKCRDSGIRRWPYRKVKSMDKIIQRVRLQIKEGSGSLSDSQLRHLHDQLQDAEAKRRQVCLDALNGAGDDSCNLASSDSAATCGREAPTPDSALTNVMNGDMGLPPLKRIRTEGRTPSGLSSHFLTPKKHLLSPPPKSMHNSFPGVTDAAGLEALLSSPAALRLASAVATPNRGSLLTPHYLGSPLKFNVDFNF